MDEFVCLGRLRSPAKAALTCDNGHAFEVMTPATRQGVRGHGRLDGVDMSELTCAVESCAEKHIEARGWCKGHYSRWIRYGDVRAEVPLKKKGQPKPQCSADTCVNVVVAKGLCATHRWRLANWGTTDDKPPTSATDRFWRHVDKTGACWLWTYNLFNTGYGAFFFGGNNVGAHRFAYEHLVGEIPPHLVVDHLCKVRHCVNPGHMEIVGRGVNSLRGDSPTAISYRTGTCVRGHPFTPENTYRWPKKPHTRRCKTCANKRQRERRQRSIGLSPERGE
jgi:hypothetical protein